MMKHVVYGATRNLYDQIPAAMKSLLDHTKVDCIHLMLEDDEIPFDCPDSVPIDVVNVKEYMEWAFPDGGPNAKTHWTKMALVRVCYPEIFDDVGTLLQLDVDTIVLDDVSPLWEVDLTGKWFAAVPEKYSNYNPYNADAYYNIGICMFNLDQMRDDGAQEQLVKWINSIRAGAVEQDALNVFGAMRGKAVAINQRYNENFACGFTDNPAVMHYLGYADKDCDRLPRLEYKKYYRELPWSEVRYV